MRCYSKELERGNIVIEVLGTLCILWTAVELLRLVVRARRVKSQSVRAWDSQGNEVGAEMVE